MYASLRDLDLRFSSYAGKKVVVGGGVLVVVRASVEKHGRQDESESTTIALARSRK